MKNAKAQSILFALFVAIAVSVTFILYPIYMFLINNQDEFWFNITEMLLPVALLTAGVSAVLFVLLAVFSGRKCFRALQMIASLLTASAVCYYVQSNYMVSYLPLLTGDEFDWSSYGNWSLLSLLLWVGLPAMTLVLVIIKRKAVQAVVTGCCACLLGMEILVLGMTYLSTAINPPEDNAAYLSKEGIYELSDDKNVVVLVSDTFQGTFMNEILEEYPEWREKLADFTFYNNTTGTSCFTYFSLAKLLTGVDFPIGKDLADGMKYAFENQTLIDTVADNGYDIAYYAGFKPTSNVQDKLLNYEGDIIVPGQQAKRNILKLLMKSTMFQGLPHQLKKYFVVLTSDYNNLLSGIDSGEKVAPFVSNDTEYRTGLLSSGLTACDTNPRYVVQYLMGVHAPYNTNRDFEIVDFPEETTVHERQIEASLAQLTLLTEYTKKLKEANLYDQTTLIFTADHGFDLRFYPVMLVKESNAKSNELRIDSVPLSHQEDYERLLKEVTGGKTFAEAIDDLNLEKGRVRYALDFRSANGYGKDTDLRSTIQIEGSADKQESYRVVRDEYALREPFEGRYSLGDALTFTDNSSNVAMYGYRSDNQYMYAHTAVMDVWFKDVVKDPLEFVVKIQNVTSTEQQLYVYVREKRIATITLADGEISELRVSITPDMIAKNRLTVRFEAPDAVGYTQKAETLGWQEYHSFRYIEGAIH